VSNRLPDIIERLPRAADKAVDDTARHIEQTIEANAWRDTGVVISTTKTEAAGTLHAEVQVGVKRGRGFYATFLEFGTSKMAARPVVQPAAHAAEPVFAQNMQNEIEDAWR
jgi:HK97 gp10 family phage protein